MSDRQSGAQLSTLAHELKTPLAIIVGFAELLGARDDERTRVEAAKRITDASERLRDALDDLLAGVAADKGDLGARLVDAMAAGRRARDEGQSE
ncbi:MAG TPA: histidine kinase dimerization/phospho-acceptor domain-containing protein [Gaiellaceae bacterium]|nr:histidine kinase dimerization/phospho-acceptor domain-containing protein [Gaiellaceae bacterium]